jgi:predicted adenylyl cyclase CyaB
MHEIEVKILEIIPDTIAAKLINELGFEKKGKGEYRAIYFDDEENSLSASGRLLRLRKEGEKVVLAYKRNISRQGAKVMEEHQTSVADFEASLQIIEGLGFRPFSETYKIREVFRKGDIEVVFDDYQGELSHIPPFLEIEAPDEAILMQYINALGFDESQALSWDTNDLVRHYADKKMG